jgi:hypothetical protein
MTPQTIVVPVLKLSIMIALIALSISPVQPLLPRKIGNAGGGVAPYGLAFMITAAAALSILRVSIFES